MLNIEITNRCNANCQFCYRHVVIERNKQTDVSFDDAVKMMEYAKTWRHSVGLKDGHFSISGYGEPLLHKDVTNIINKACTMFKDVVFISNGIALSKTTTDKLLQTGLSRIEFSVTGFSHNIYNKYQGFGSVDDTLRNRVYENIRHLIEKRNETMHKLSITIRYILNKETMGELLDFINHWSGLVDDIKITPMVNFNQKFDKIKSFDDTMTYEQKFFRPCNLFEISGQICANGDITPCCSAPSEVLYVGNYAKHTPDEIINSTKYKELKRVLTETLDYGVAPEICKICPVVTTKESAISYLFYSKMEAFDSQKIDHLKGVPVVFFGLSEMLVNLIGKIKLYSDADLFDFVIIDNYKDKLLINPAVIANDSPDKYKVYKPTSDILSNRKIIVFSDLHFEDINNQLAQLGLGCESYKHLLK